MNINYGLVVVDPENPNAVLHFCGYENEPTQNDVDELYAELRTDEEFGLTDIIQDLDIADATEEMMKYFKEQIAIAQNE